MLKEAVFTLKLEAELRKEFMAEVADADRSASQVMRDLMRDYIELRRQAREHAAYLQIKVNAARASMRAGLGRSNEEVEAAFADRRSQAAGDPA